MATVAPITVTAGASTIVYNPQRISPELTTLANRDGGNSATMKAIDLTFSAATAARKTDKFGVELDIPLVRVDPVKGNYADDVARVRVSLTVPETATDAEREEIYESTVEVVSGALLAGMVKDFDLPNS